ncbi:MAG: carboxymuconolactone decarboxylase family protein [Curvibacter sp.]
MLVAPHREQRSGTRENNEGHSMRIPEWTTERKPQPAELVQAILARRGGTLINLDTALLWSEPLARGWNTYLKAVRSELPTSLRLRELGICTVALLTGAKYEYHHHAPDFLAAGGTQAQLDALNAFVRVDPRGLPNDPALNELDRLVIRYAAQMTLDVQVSDDVFDALRQHFDETGLVELTCAIATYNMVARFLVALQVSTEK